MRYFYLHLENRTMNLYIRSNYLTSSIPLLQAFIGHLLKEMVRWFSCLKAQAFTTSSHFWGFQFV